MRFLRSFVGLVILAGSANAEPLALDLSTSIKRAQTSAPAARAASRRVSEASFARDVAGSYSSAPEVELAGGHRFGDGTVAGTARIGHDLEPGRRGARERAANAGLNRAEAERARDMALLAARVADAFFDAKHAVLVEELAQRARGLAAKAVTTAERRRKAGDITDLDVNLARSAAGRAASMLAAAKAERVARIGALAVLVGARPEDEIEIKGELRPAETWAATGRRRANERADARALEAAAREASSELEVARANARPTLGIFASYEREEGHDIVLGGVSFSLPVTSRPRAEGALARARSVGLADEQRLVQNAAAREVADADRNHAFALEAVTVFERDVLPALAESELLLDKTMTAGQLAVGDYLVARQEILNGQREHLDRLRALARAAVQVRVVGGAPLL